MHFYFNNYGMVTFKRHHFKMEMKTIWTWVFLFNKASYVSTFSSLIRSKHTSFCCSVIKYPLYDTSPFCRFEPENRRLSVISLSGVATASELIDNIVFIFVTHVTRSQLRLNRRRVGRLESKIVQFNWDRVWTPKRDR